MKEVRGLNHFLFVSGYYKYRTDSEMDIDNFPTIIFIKHSNNYDSKYAFPKFIHIINVLMWK
jgi:hypothetical protein